jgi:hypothetical protein
MSWDDLHDALSDMSTEALTVLGVVCAVLVVAAIVAQIAALRVARELARAEEELVDRATGLLPRSAIAVRLGIELTWAQATDTPICVAVLRVRGAHFERAARVLRHAMRGEEQAFLLGEQRILVELWGVEPDAAAGASRRFGRALAAAGFPVVDAGLAIVGRDGYEPDELITAALQDLRPVDDPIAPGIIRSTTPWVRLTGVFAAVLPWFGLLIAMLVTTWKLVPAAIEPGLGDGARTGSEWAIALIAVIGFPIGAALVHVAAWNFGGGFMPQSRPFGVATRGVAIATALVIGVPLAWGVFAPSTPEIHGVEAIGAMLAMIALVVITMLHARQLVAAGSFALTALWVLGGVVAWCFVVLTDLPLAADAARLVAAAALGALLARAIERLSWLVILAVIAAVTDIWSVVSDSGLSNSLLDSSGGGGNSPADRLVDVLMFTGPRVDGTPLFQLGVTDLVFLALFLAWAHDWRFDMRVVTGALIAGAWAAILTTVVTDTTVPVLPFLAGAMILVVAARAWTQRIQVRRTGAAALESATAA